MNAVQRVDVAGDASTTEQVSSPAMTPTLTEPLCGRAIFHIHHDTDAGACEGYLDPAQMSPAEIREAMDKVRREAAGYGYWSGYQDAAAARPYANAWRPGGEPA